MKVNFSIEDLADYLYNSTDHSDISNGFKGYTYSVWVSPDGELTGEDEDAQKFDVDFDFTEDLWDGINKDRFQECGWWREHGSGSYPEDAEHHDYYESEYDNDIDRLLGRADSQEHLDNPNYREACEYLMRQIEAFEQ